MLMDGTTYLGRWPFRKLRCTDAEKLMERMQRCGIDRAVVSSLDAVLYKDVMSGNEALAEEISGCGGRLTSFAVINPNYICWKKDLYTCVEKLGMRGVELFPVYHGYDASLPALRELLNLAADMGIPVRLPGRLVDVRGRHWMDVPENLEAEDMLGIVRLCRRTNFMLAACSAASVARVLLPEMKNREGEVLFGISKTDPFSFSPSFLMLKELVGANRMFFEACMPFQYPEPQLVKLHFGGLTSEEQAQIGSENVLRLLKEA